LRRRDQYRKLQQHEQELKSMTTILLTHSACLYHETPPGHPECSDRLRAVLRALEDEAFQYLVREEAPRAATEEIGRVHPSYYIDAVMGAVPETGYGSLDPDTHVSSGSGEAALRAAGAVVAGVDRVISGSALNAFCAVRPPGHHAEPTRAMGFCLFNNVAIGALHARAKHGLKRIAVVDFDVHHGNGTQAMFEEDENLFFASSHQMPLYPGTGRASERGRANNIVNATLDPGAGSHEFRQAWDNHVLPALDAFRPEFILISAGFDAHRRDPLANLNLTEDDFAWVTEKVCGIAKERCASRVVSTLEGGYDLNALALSAAAHVKALMAA
jgi:acetoin utilization deacetylase AcuC-like enzyme